MDNSTLDLIAGCRLDLGSVKLRATLVNGPTERVARCVDGRCTWATVQSARIVFSGGKHGNASIDASCSDKVRILAHWDGYCAASGVRIMPVVGEYVTFPSGSSSSGLRRGKVIKVGTLRATVAYRFANGFDATKAVPIVSLRVSNAF